MNEFDKMQFPQNGFAGLVFDLDGTLVDSMPAHFEAWCLALESFGVVGVFREDVFYAMGGRPTKDIVLELNDEYDLPLDPDAVASAKREAYIRLLDRVEIVEEVVAYAREQYGKVPMAVATGGTRLVTEKTLRQTGLSDLFDEVVTSDDVVNGKPAPDMFLLAAEKIGVAPEKCRVLEDAPAGILAAQEAGMAVITVPTPVRVV